MKLLNVTDIMEIVKKLDAVNNDIEELVEAWGMEPDALSEAAQIYVLSVHGFFVPYELARQFAVNFVTGFLTGAMTIQEVEMRKRAARHG